MFGAREDPDGEDWEVELGLRELFGRGGDPEGYDAPPASLPRSAGPTRGEHTSTGPAGAASSGREPAGRPWPSGGRRNPAAPRAGLGGPLSFRDASPSESARARTSSLASAAPAAAPAFVAGSRRTLQSELQETARRGEAGGRRDEGRVRARNDRPSDGARPPVDDRPSDGVRPPVDDHPSDGARPPVDDRPDGPPGRPNQRTPPAADLAPPPPGGAPAPGSARRSIGYRLLCRAGWREGAGLGRDEQGRTEPIQAVARRGRVGIGRGEEGRGGVAEETAGPRAAAGAQGAAPRAPQTLVSSLPTRNALPALSVSARQRRRRERRQDRAEREAAERAKRRATFAALSGAPEPSEDAHPLARPTALSDSNPLLW